MLSYERLYDGEGLTRARRTYDECPSEWVVVMVPLLFFVVALVGRPAGSDKPAPRPKEVFIRFCSVSMIISPLISSFAFGTLQI